MTPEYNAIERQTELLRDIAALLRVQKSVPWEQVLWTADDIAAYLQVSSRTVSEKYAVQPGFPKATRPGGGYNRWYASEIVEWVERSRHPKLKNRN